MRAVRVIGEDWSSLWGAVCVGSSHFGRAAVGGWVGIFIWLIAC